MVSKEAFEVEVVKALKKPENAEKPVAWHGVHECMSSGVVGSFVDVGKSNPSACSIVAVTGRKCSSIL